MSNSNESEARAKAAWDREGKAISGAGIGGDPTGSGSGYRGPKDFVEIAGEAMEGRVWSYCKPAPCPTCGR
jgi:hypothetical protein